MRLTWRNLPTARSILSTARSNPKPCGMRPDAVGSHQTCQPVGAPQCAALDPHASRHCHRRGRGDCHGHNRQRHHAEGDRRPVQARQQHAGGAAGTGDIRPGGSGDVRSFTERNVATLRSELAEVRGIAPSATRAGTGCLWGGELRHDGDGHRIGFLCGAGLDF